MHLPDSVPAILVLFGLGTIAYGMNWPVSIPWIVAPPVNRSYSAMGIGAVIFLAGMWSWFCEHRDATGKAPDCKNCSEIIAPEIDLDLVAQLEYPVVLPGGADMLTDSAFYSRQVIRAMQFAHDSVARVYARQYGLSTITLKSLAQDLDTFISVYSRRNCQEMGTGKCVVIFVLTYPLNPVGKIKTLSDLFDVPLRSDRALSPESVLLPPGIRFETPEITFEKSKYLLTDEQKLKIAVLAGILHRQLPPGKKVKVFCDGYASPETIDPNPGIPYSGAARCCPGIATIGLSDPGACAAAGPFIRNNRTLSFVRAYEGASCLYAQLKDIAPLDPNLKNVEFYYRGNGILPRDPQRKITFTPIF